MESVVTIPKYKKIAIDRAIFIKVLSDGTVSYPTVSTFYFINTTNIETAFPELRRFLKNYLRLNSKEDLSVST